MGRKPKPKANTAIDGILNALKFCEPASRDIGQPNQTHLRLGNHWAVAFDGVVAIGHKIDSDIAACPHTSTFITALKKCTDATQITQLGDGRLSIKSGRFQSFVPCLTDDLLGPVAPDPACAHITPAVINALRIVGPIAQENAQRIVLASVLLRSGSAVATDGHIIAEAWHGVDLPPVVVPKAFITVLSKIEKPAIYFGFSERSATFYFDDQSWIRTQLYSEPWLDANQINRVLNMQSNQWPIPAGMAEALEKLDDLEEESNRIYFGAKHLRTNQSTEAGSICEIDGALQEGLCFDIEYLKMCLPLAKSVDFAAGETREAAVFYGDNWRGVVMQIKTNERQIQPDAPITPFRNPMDDGIPF